MPATSSKLLRFGSLSAELHGTELRRVSVNGFEVLRRLHFVARDHNWGNIPQKVKSCLYSRNARTLRFQAESTLGRSRLAWSGVLTFEKTAIELRLTGEALSNFTTNRAGLCVLLPIEGFAGARCFVTPVSGNQREFTLPRAISPHQPCSNLGLLRVRHSGGRQTSFAFCGDRFEMEDQRNWMDGSYKIYSRPLSLPFPYTLKAGERFAQTFRLTFEGRFRARAQATPLVTIGTGRRLPRTKLGAALPSLGRAMTRVELSSLRTLGFDHVRADISDFGRRLRSQIQRAAIAAREIQAPLELAVFLPSPSTRSTRALLAELKRVAPPLARLLIFDANEDCSTRAANKAIEQLRSAFPDVQIACGSDFNFTELNRGLKKLPPNCAVTFAANPQVHADDERSIVECLEGLPWILRTARARFPTRPLVLSPLTLRPRKNAAATERSLLRAKELFDPRQRSQFWGAWIAAAWGHLRAGKLHSATIGETAGPGGLISAQGRLLPVGSQLAECLRASRELVRPFASSHPLLVGGWACESFAMVANLSGQTKTVRVCAPGQADARVRLQPWGTRKILLAART